MTQFSEATIPSRRHAGWSLRSLIAEGARAWNVSPRMVVLISLGIPFIVGVAGIVAAVMGKTTYKGFTGEDGVAEGLQVLLFAATLFLSLIIAHRLWRRGDTLFAVLYVLAGAGMLFIVGEELNWGQRIFGWETPEQFQAINKQEETNLHNIYGVGSVFKWLHVVIGALGTVVPLLVLRWRPRSQRLGQAIDLFVPHFTLVPYFLATLLWRLQANLWDPPKRLYFVISEYSEVMELILAIAFFLFMWFQFRRTRPDQAGRS